jgi:membrane-associated phospholipid phosphatase
MLAPVLGLIFSTVYLRYHYAVDVLAGAALAVLVVWTGPILHRRWEMWRAGRDAPDPAA